ncbi:hypothetical protein Bbelb_215220 [Branchiostoma belcheri]|nr:hypothetical protein Bbelb_215220 [Branchiostoma belcheri]
MKASPTEKRPFKRPFVVAVCLGRLPVPGGKRGLRTPGQRPETGQDASNAWDAVRNVRVWAPFPTGYRAGCWTRCRTGSRTGSWAGPGDAWDGTGGVQTAYPTAGRVSGGCSVIVDILILPLRRGWDGVSDGVP